MRSLSVTHARKAIVRAANARCLVRSVSLIVIVDGIRNKILLPRISDTDKV
jgi:hypothetical protein